MDSYDYEKTDREMLDRYGDRARPGPEQATAAELGAEPLKNGPERVNHLAWCKQRALLEIPRIEVVISSLMMDFADDPRTADSLDVIQELIFPLAMTGHLRSAAEQRKMILDFT